MRDRGVNVVMAQADITDADGVRQLIRADREAIQLRYRRSDPRGSRARRRFDSNHGHGSVRATCSTPRLKALGICTRQRSPPKPTSTSSSDAFLDLFSDGFGRSAELCRRQLFPGLARALPPATWAARDVGQSWRLGSNTPGMSELRRTIEQDVDRAFWNLRACM